MATFASGTGRFLAKDPLSLFLMIASIGLALTFALLLGSIQPSSAGRQVPLSTVQQLARKHYIATALLLDHDARVEVKTTGRTPILRRRRNTAAGAAGADGETEARSASQERRLGP